MKKTGPGHCFSRRPGSPRRAILCAMAAAALLFAAPVSAATLPATISLGAGEEDVLIYGPSASSWLSYNGAGTKRDLISADLNGDGIQDIIVGAHSADGPGGARNDCGEVYIYYGSPSLAGTKDAAGTDGAAPDVVIYGASAQDQLGYSGNPVAADVNGDGITDLLLHTHLGDGPGEGRGSCGEVYVVYGSDSLPATVDLATDADVTIYAPSSSDLMCREASVQAGDVNGDGIKDLVLGTPYGDGPTGSSSSSGEVHIVYGSAALAAAIDLATDADVSIWGATSNGYLTNQDSMQLGDVNGDGILDILLAAPSWNRAYIIYGSDSLAANYYLSGNQQDVLITGASSSDCLRVALVGDLTGDGFSDLFLDASDADGPGESRTNCGEAYLVFGQGDSVTASAGNRDHAGACLPWAYTTARCTIGFESGSASATTVTLTRNDTGVNRPDLSTVADVRWEVTSNRAAFGASLTFHYLESEVAGINQALLRVMKAPAVDGEYVEVEGAVVDWEQNTVTVSGVDSFSVFILEEGDGGPEFNCFIKSMDSRFPKLGLNH